MKRIDRTLGLLPLLVATACASSQATVTPAGPSDLTPEARPATTTQAAAEPPGLTDIPRFEPGDCPFQVPPGAPVECGFVVVPADHNRPEGPTLRLAVVIVRDQSEAHQPDPVILLAGGPGEKVVANGLILAQIFVPTIPSRDFVFFDQRGAGLSEPALECPEWEHSLLDTLDEIDPETSMRTNFEALLACRDRLLAEGRDLSLYNNLQNAADVESIRQALGYSRVNLYGGSYGSLLAQVTAREHPAAIRSIVLWSVWPVEKSLLVDATTATADAVLQLLETCESDDACRQSYPELREVLFAVIDRLNAEPATITVTNPLDGVSYAASLSGDAVFSNLVGLLYQTQLIPALPQAIYDIYEGDYELMAKLISQNLVMYRAMSRGMTYSFVCTDDLIGRTPEDIIRLKATLPPQLAGRLGPDLIRKYGIFGVCEHWPVQQASADVKRPLVSEIPVLLLEGDLDPVTPSAYARQVASHLPNSYFYEFPGIGHNILVSSECAREMAGAFLEDPSQEPDSRCVDELPGLAFDIESEPKALVLEEYVDEARGFRGLLPVGWQELAPANLLRSSSALDPSYFVLEAAPLADSEMLALLASQLAFDPALEPVSTEELGSFTWDFYAFERRGYPADLALTERGGVTYFVFMISAEEEHEAMHEQLFLPAVEAMSPLG